MERLRKFAKEGFKQSKTDAKSVCNPSKPKEEHVSFVTNFKEEKFSFTWRIENMDRCNLKNGEYLESPTFSTRFCGEAKWTMRIYPNSKKSPYDCEETLGLRKCEKVGLFIRIISTTHQNLTFRYRLSCERLLGNADKEIHAYPKEGVSQIETFSMRTNNLYGTNGLYCPHGVLVTSHETLIIRCDIYIINIFKKGAPDHYAKGEFLFY